MTTLDQQLAEYEGELLDPGVAGYVRILRDAGVETFESCEGGLGHALPEPTVCPPRHDEGHLYERAAATEVRAAAAPAGHGTACFTG